MDKVVREIPAVGRQGATLRQDGVAPAKYGPDKDMTLRQFQHHIDSQPRTTLIAGYHDLSAGDFGNHYHERLDTGMTRGDTFILSDEPGTSAMALKYLILNGVPGDKITIYYCSQNTAKLSVREQYRVCKAIIVAGGEMERTKAISRDCEEDFIWLRPEDELDKKLSAAELLNARYTGLKELVRLGEAKGIEKWMRYRDMVA